MIFCVNNHSSRQLTRKTNQPLRVFKNGDKFVQSSVNWELKKCFNGSARLDNVFYQFLGQTQNSN